MVDLTGDTVSPSVLKSGVTAHDESGNQIVGELFDFFPGDVTISKGWNTELTPVQEHSKVIFANQVLIDLTDDTLLDGSQLLYGYVAHTRSGKKISGTFLSEYPESHEELVTLEDSNGNLITDSSAVDVSARQLYKKTSDTTTSVSYTKL